MINSIIISSRIIKKYILRILELNFFVNYLKIIPIIIGIFFFYLLPFELHAKKKTVVIDAGHGGFDKGGNKSGVYEKYLALDVAFHLNNYLKSKNIKTRLTRKRDIFLPLYTRTKISNRTSNSVFVSIHFNYSYKSHIRGIETFWYNRASRNLAYYVHRKMISTMRSNNRGIKRKSFVVISKNIRPAILLECGFLSNAREAKRFFKKKERIKIAHAIGKGLIEYMKNH